MATEMNERGMEKLTEGLEGELRKLGTPYSSPEPDPQYWASLRVNIMEKIEAQERRTPAHWLDQAKAWISGHLVSSGIIGAALASVIAFAVIVNPSDNPKQTSQPQVAQNTAVVNGTDTTHKAALSDKTDFPAPAVAPKSFAAAEQQKPLSQHKHAEQHASKFIKRDLQEKQELAQADFGNLSESDLMGHADESVIQPTLVNSEYPVSLNELSAPELESVLNDLQQGQ